MFQDGHGKARGYLCAIKQFDFIVALCAADHVLSNTVALSTMLQKKSLDLIEAAQEARVVINMKAERGDPLVWKEVNQRGKLNRLKLSLTLANPCQEQPEGSHTGSTCERQTQSPTGKELCTLLVL